MIDQQQLEALVRRITQTVLANLHQAAPAVPRLLIVDTQQQHPEIWQQVQQTGLATQFTVQWLSVTPEMETRYQAESGQYLADYRSTDFLLLAALTPTDLAKSALGIADNVVTACLSNCFQRDLPAYYLKQQFDQMMQQGNAQYSQLMSKYARQLQSFGLRGTSWDMLAATQRQQTLVTAEMVRQLAPQTELTVARNAVITPLAQELLQQKQIQIRYHTVKRLT